ncbi:MAG: YjgP/YjgQ family permease [Nevskiaceae bacterium]|nr:MAG: YjgP/YjgQ family permease [Nevskiaceae bacterium]TBR74095.1 MAG: YjgP/YjgQ family permease [Nevskiaceae bacterium]
MKLDRYILRLLAAPFALTVTCLLTAFLLDRLLRLFQVAANAGADFSTTLFMAADLVPHYLQQAIPAGFFAAIFMVVARLGDDNELDAMLAAGHSIVQISRPFCVVAVLLAGVSFYLYGFLQPYARYAYNEERHAALNAGWNARVQENTFIDVGQGVTLAADAVDPTGRQLTGVFMERQSDNGLHLTITARHGMLVATADGSHLRLQLEHGRMVQEGTDRRVDVEDFRHGVINDGFTPDAAPFRARGNAQNELTLPELRAQIASPAPSISRATLQAEFHARIARVLLLLLLPFLGIPLGMASKRGRRTPGVVFAVLAVLGVDHALRFGQSVAATGSALGPAAVWIPWVVFAVLSLWLFRASLQRPGDNPVSRAVDAIEAVIERANPRRPRRKPTP